MYRSNGTCKRLEKWNKQYEKRFKKGGVVLITTRSFGYEYHAWPYDYWRYEEEDMKKIFSDFKIEKIEKGPDSPGIYLKARKPDNFSENNISNYKLYSIVANKKTLSISFLDYLLNSPRLLTLLAKDKLRQLLPKSLKKGIKNIFRISK